MRIEELIRHASTMPLELWSKPIDGFGHPSVREQLSHVLSCEGAWVRGLRNQSGPGRSFDSSSPGTLLEARRAVGEDTRRYIDELDEAQLHAPLAVYPSNWVGPHRTPAFILLHVITHAFHHKGQIVAMFRLLSHPAPDTDLQRG